MPPLIYICTTASLIPLHTSCFPAPNPVLYYKVMTPQWLEDHASLSQLIAATPENLHFKVNKIHSRLIKVPMLQRVELPTDDIIVTITVHQEDPPRFSPRHLRWNCLQWFLDIRFWELSKSGMHLYDNWKWSHLHLNSEHTLWCTDYLPTLPKHCHTDVLPCQQVGVLQHPI